MQVKFFKFSSTILRTDPGPRKTQTPWTVYKAIEWNGKVFNKGQVVSIVHILEIYMVDDTEMLKNNLSVICSQRCDNVICCQVRTQRTVPVICGTIRRFLLCGDYDGDVYAVGGEMEIVQVIAVQPIVKVIVRYHAAAWPLHRNRLFSHPMTLAFESSVTDSDVARAEVFSRRLLANKHASLASHSCICGVNSGARQLLQEILLDTKFPSEKQKASGLERSRKPSTFLQSNGRLTSCISISSQMLREVGGQSAFSEAETRSTLTRKVRLFW